MKDKVKILIGLIVLSIVSSIGLGFSVSRETPVIEIIEVEKITHAQDVWISALEWCESRGKITAVNPKDRDNTPSYYSFQFKPKTFRWYGEKYGVIEVGQTDEQIMELIKRHDLQREILENMVNDPKVKWENEFPDCVKRKIGRPPTY